MLRATAGSSSDSPRFFATPHQLRQWLRKHHQSDTELWVGLHKKESGRPSISWPELVDQLLCFGWIDGLRKSVDESSYTIRVTPRKARSHWSAVNLRRMDVLIRAGEAEAAGLAAYEARGEGKPEAYSFEREQVTLGSGLEAEFRRNREAWQYFMTQPPSYRKTATSWVVSAKREETQRRRLGTLIRDSEAGQRISLLRR